MEIARQDFLEKLQDELNERQQTESSLKTKGIAAENEQGLASLQSPPQRIKLAPLKLVWKGQRKVRRQSLPAIIVQLTVACRFSIWCL